MKIILDTNVVISAFAARGLCHDVLEVCLNEHEIILSEYILSEIKINLTKKIKLPKNIVMNIIDYLNTEALIVVPVNVQPSICRDCNDLPVIGTAVAGKVNVIITGDSDLLVIKKYKSIKILSPREFWRYLRK